MFGQYPLIRWMVCMYFVSFHRMPFHCCLLFPFHFSLIQSHLSIFLLLFFFRIIFKKSLPRPVSRSFLPEFLSRSFKNSDLKLRFQVNYCEECKILLQFLSLTCEYPVFSASFIEQIVLSQLSILGSDIRYQLALSEWVCF